MIVAFVHILVIVFLLMFVFSNKLDAQVAAIYTADKFIIAFMVFLVYVTIFGTLSTFISINERLKSVESKLTDLKKSD